LIEAEGYYAYIPKFPLYVVSCLFLFKEWINEYVLQFLSQHEDEHSVAYQDYVTWLISHKNIVDIVRLTEKLENIYA